MQRAGRAGRTAPGRCLRLYSKESFEGMEPGRAPDVFRSPLSQTLLLLAAFNLSADSFDWISRPSDEAIAAAKQELLLLGALSDETAPKLTVLGKLIPRLMVEPRIAYMLHRACLNGFASDACLLAGLLSSVGMLVSKSAKMDADVRAKQEACREPFVSEDGDLLTLFNLLKELEHRKGLMARAKEFGLRPPAVGGVFATCKELRRNLTKCGVWPKEEKNAGPSEAKDLLVSALALNAGVSRLGRWDACLSVESSLSGRIGALLPRSASSVQAPALFVWGSVVQLAGGCLFQGFVSVSREQLRIGCPSVFAYLEPKLSLLPTFEVVLPPTSAAVARMLVSKWREDRRLRVWPIEHSVSSGQIRCLVAEQNQQLARNAMDSLLNGIIDRVRKEVQKKVCVFVFINIYNLLEKNSKKVIEEMVPGGGMLVLGAGGLAVHLLPPEAFVRVLLSNLPETITATSLLSRLTALGLPDPSSVDVLITGPGRAELQFLDSSQAQAAVKLLSGELIEGARVKWMPATSLQAQEGERYNLEISWPLGVSSGKATIWFPCEADATACLQSGFARACAAGVKLFKPKESDVAEAAAAASKKKNSGHKLVVANLPLHVDEVDLEALLRSFKLRFDGILVKRVAAVAAEESDVALSVQLAELRMLLPNLDAIESQTSFCSSSSLRAGLKVFYRSREDCAEALKASALSELPRKYGQPVRVKGQFKFKISVHERIYALRRGRFDEISSFARANGVTVEAQKQVAQNVVSATSVKRQMLVNLCVTASESPVK